MKKSLFERFLFDTPAWLISTLVYGIGGLIIFLLLFGGCAPLEPLPGLCYTDKTGTYLCPKDEKEKRINCSHLLGEEEWFLCMENQ